MARRGYLTRELDQADRRSFLLRLTDDGSPAAQACRGAMTAIEREAAGSLAPGDLAGFGNVVRALTEAAR